ncbi:MAG: hypothetical protein V1857_07010 [archaeon]
MVKKTRATKLSADRVKDAAHLLLFKRGRMPGAKDWELRARIGEKYEDVLDQLNEILSGLDLEVKKITESTELSSRETITAGARYLARLKQGLTLKEARMCGWRIDNLAGLCMMLTYIVSKQGKAPRKEVESIVGRKFGRWRTLSMIDAFIRNGYLGENEEGLLHLDWRTKAEVDLKTLMSNVIETESV